MMWAGVGSGGGYRTDWLQNFRSLGGRRRQPRLSVAHNHHPPPADTGRATGDSWAPDGRADWEILQRKYYRGNITEQNTSQQEFLYQYISFYFHFYRYQNRAEEKPWLAPIKIQNIFIIKNIFFLLEKSKVWQASPLPPSKAARRQPIYSIFRLNVLKW